MRRALLAAPAALFLLSCAVSTWSLRRHFEGGITWEFCHYAEIGRNIAKGRGLMTRLVTPYDLAYLDSRGLPFDAAHPAPVADRFPLQAYLAAFAERLGGARDSSVAMVCVASLGLWAAATAVVGSLLLSPAEGLFAGLFIALDPSFQRGFVLWGLPDFGFALLVLLAAAVLVRARTAADCALAGALAGACFLARYNVILWLPLWAWLAGKRGSRALAAFAAGLAAAASPALAYNLRWFHGLTAPYTGVNLARRVATDLPPWLYYRLYDPLQLARAHPGALARKFAAYLGLYASHLPGWWQMQALFPFAGWGLWTLRRPDTAARRFGRLAAGMLLLELLAFSLLRYEELGPRAGGRYFLWFAPAALLLAARGARELGARFGRPNAALALLGAATLAFFVHELALPQGRPAYPGALSPRDWPELAAVERLVPEGGLVAANIAGQVAWYANRPAVALPVDPEQLDEIAARHPLSGLLLCRLPIGELSAIPGWAPLAESRLALDDYARGRGWTVAADFGTSALLLPGRSR